ncbi:MAG: hypothetical protein CM15mP74_15560 [Halieaceae bacterium]|nr:MAG: hypothetical protein CM15mP74_15560 [Halieaceae bacterium]
MSKADSLLSTRLAGLRCGVVDGWPVSYLSPNLPEERHCATLRCAPDARASRDGALLVNLANKNENRCI